MLNVQPARTHSTLEQETAGARVSVRLGFHAGCPSPAAACCCAACLSCAHRQSLAQDCKLRFSSHSPSTCCRDPVPAGDGCSRTRRLSAPPASEPLRQQCAVFPGPACGFLPRGLQLPLPPAVTQAVRGRVYSLCCLAQGGGGKAGGKGGGGRRDG